MVVTPGRLAQELINAPYTAYVRNEEDIRMEDMVRTTPEAMEGIPSVMVQKTAYGQGSPYMRGFTGFRTLMLIDGVRLNNSVFRDGPNQYWNTVDPFSVDRYEILMGPASVLYGSDAIGGVVNALTLAPPEFREQPAWAGNVFYRGATAERSSIGRLNFGAALSKAFSFRAGLTLKDFGDLEGGHDVGRQDHTGYREQDYDACAEYRFNSDHKLRLTWQQAKLDDAWRTHKTIYGITWHGLEHGSEKKRALDQQRQLACLRYDGHVYGGVVDCVQATVSRQVQKEDRDRIKGSGAHDQQGFDVVTWGASLQLESGSPLGTWIYGMDYYHDSVDSYKHKYTGPDTCTSAIQGPVGDDASYDSYGAYVEDHVQVLSERLEIVPGLRYNRNEANARKVEDPVTGDAISISDHWDALAASLRTLLHLTKDHRHNLFAGLSQGFRAPNLSDLTRLDTARSDEMETPVEDLDPEKFLCFEAGIKLEEDRWAAQLSGYYTHIEQMIVRTPTGRMIDGLHEVTKKNSGEGWVTGVEISGSVNLTRTWSCWAMASWMNGKVDTYPTSDAEKERDYISRLMPPTAEVGVRWDEPRKRYWFETDCRMAAKADKLSLRDEGDTQRIPHGGTPGYAVFGIRGGCRVQAWLDVSMALENIFDKDYRIHGSGVNEPGRNLVLTVAAQF
jgi:hemoglobin/transferrin/lactoferrin receptor protein